MRQYVSWALFILLMLNAFGLNAQERESIPQALYLDKSLPVETRIDDLLKRMTLQEKLEMLSGTGFASRPIPRLGIPAMNMTDGPVGVRWDRSTAFPVGIAMAATWDTALIRKVGWALAREAKAKKRNVLLGPCVNIARVPQGGRNFESFGEDPYLTSRITVAYVNGVQSEHVIATTKHYACNNQEHERLRINEIVDKRALHEIYLPAFKAAVQEAGAWSIMAAYNKVNGFHCTENEYLLTDVLKKKWGFKGFVMSDWGAVHSTLGPLKAGLDLEMPEGEYLRPNSVLPLLQDGQVSQAAIDDKVRRMLRAMFSIGIFDGRDKIDQVVPDNEQHRAVALEVAREAVVLLKNNRDLLPLDKERVKSIAVIGPNAARARTGGGGSSEVTPFYAVTPFDGLRRKLGDRVKIEYAAGCTLEGDVTPIESRFLFPSGGNLNKHGLLGLYFDNMELRGQPVLQRVDSTINFDWGGDAPSIGMKADSFSVRWTGEVVADAAGTYEFTVLSDDGVRLYIDGQLVLDDWRDHGVETHSTRMHLDANKPYQIKLEYYEKWGAAVVKLGWQRVDLDPIAEAVRIAKKCDVAVVFAGLSNHFESEGFDRTTLELPKEQVKLIKAVVRANPKTVVVLNSGAPVLMEDWIDSVQAVLEMWYAGEEGGTAIADIILGDVNPSGKLPVTFPRRWEDCSAYGSYPGKDTTTYYTDGIYVGYRHFDKRGINPRFPFGYGLSYTKFRYENITVRPGIVHLGQINDSIEVMCEVANVGRRRGAEVVQLYVSDLKPSVDRPVKELKAFQRVELNPGEKKTVSFMLDKSAFAFYDIKHDDWVVEPGKFQLLLGSSSRDIRLRGDVLIK